MNRNPRLFDATRPLVIVRSVQLYDHDVTGGDPLIIVEADPKEKGEVTKDIALRLWLTGIADYSGDVRPTPVETPEQGAERLTEMDDLGGGWFLIRAPWLGEGEKVHGKAKAAERRAAIVAKGDTKGVRVDGDGDGGWFNVTAPWLDDAEKVQGHDAAWARADALIAEGPPAGWVLLTPEEKQAKVEQEAGLAMAREIAEREAAEAAERDKAEAAERERAAAAEAERQRAAQEEAAKATEGDSFTATKGRGGWYSITGPGISSDDPVKVQGDEARDAKLAELAKAHTEAQPLTELQPVEGIAAQVLVYVGDNEWTVTAPWLESGEPFNNGEAAEARQAELRAEGPPAGWVAPEPEVVAEDAAAQE